ncbi:TonB-dependent siderophore receptor [Pseudomonas syringae]|uniref:TonB-dependent siderophore receptor n=1 Tax=Pseudomonas syringae TaxID=317 RepID=UPI001F340749|nr:TonB-dependent receptor [Pseudomonas syringae]
MGYLKGSIGLPALAITLFGVAYMVQAVAAQPATQKVVHFEVAGGALDQALLQISRQGGVPISFQALTVEGLKSAPIKGDMTLGEAVDQALYGSGLRSEQSDIGLSIERAAQEARNDTQLKTVTVTGQRVRQAKVSSGALGSASVLETPFSVVQVNSEQLKERQVKALNKVFSSDSTVQSNGDTYSLTASNLTVRGVRLDNAGSYKINGLPIFITTLELPMESFESVQLLKGASGFMYGFGAPGGVVNFETKKPTDENTLSIDAGFRSNSVWSEHVDVGGRTGPEDTLGYRLNATHEEGETPTRSQVKRDSYSLSLDARINPDLTWTADTMYQERVIKGGIQNYRLPSYRDSSLPDVINPNSDRQGIAGTTFNTRAWMAATGLHWNINQDWTASLDYNHFFQTRKYISEYPTLLNKAGDYQDFISTGDGTAIYDQVQAMLQGNFSTGPIGHKAVVGVSWQNYERRSATTSLFKTVGTNNLYTDPKLITYTGQIDYPTYHVSDIVQKSVFASDTLDLTHGWSLLGGLRLTDYTQDVYNTAGVQTTDYRKVPLSPTVALMYRPRPDTTFYASYVKALEAGETAGTTYTNAGETLDPIDSEQYEIGVKTDRQTWGGSIAVFRLDRGADYANSAGAYVQGGEQRFQGLELNGRLNVTDTTVLNSSSTWLDAKFTKSEESLVGNRVSGVPRFQQTLEISQKVPALDGLKLYTYGKYNGKSDANDTNTLQLPSTTLFGAGANYSIAMRRHEVTLRAAVDNIANRRYWAFASGNSVYLGAPRTFSFNVSFDY